MHQYQLLTFGSKFGIIPSENSRSPASFTAEGYDTGYSFLSRKSRRTLTFTQFKQLQHHYKTIHSTNGHFDDQEFNHMDPEIEVWHRCRVGQSIFHCKESQRRNSRRLNYLACITHQVDTNAHVSYNRRPENLVPRNDYVYIQFYGVHRFRGQAQMVMYSEYRKFSEHDGLVEDIGSRFFGFQDIVVLDHLCARVPGAGNKIYFVEERIAMEERLRKALGVR